MFALISAEIPSQQSLLLGMLLVIVITLLTGFLARIWEKRKDGQFNKLRKILEKERVHNGFAPSVQGLQMLARAEGITLDVFDAKANAVQRTGIYVLYDPVAECVMLMGF